MNAQAELKTPTGLELETDPVEQMLNDLGIPLNRENYLEMAYAGMEIPDPLPAELEEQLPDRYRNEVVPVDPDDAGDYIGRSESVKAAAKQRLANRKKAGK